MYAVSLTDAADDDPDIIQGFKVSVSLSGIASCLTRLKLQNVVCVIGCLWLTSCGGGGGGGGVVVVDILPVDVADSFVPENEEVIGFPDTAVGTAERQRVAALHQRGGTGKNEVVGIFDSGINPDHSDLTGQFQYICSLGRCNGSGGSDNDNRSALDRTDYQSPLHDTDGHGSIVNSIVAGRRDGTGIYGIAYQAKIASFGNTAPVPWDEGCDLYDNCNGLEHAWGSVFDQQIARGVDWMRSLNVKTINNSWSRTRPWENDHELSNEEVRNLIRGFMPLSLSAFQSYVTSGGVAVWANGNRGTDSHPDMEAVLPHYFSALKPGWLAVAALNQNGLIARFSQRCGIAAEWCISAPGEVIAASLDGKWRFAGGTSIAAPYVTGSLAALKSLFPSLSYHQLRTRILATADKSAPYSNAQLYGQGRLNLDAASVPLGGTNFVVGAQDSGPIVPTAGAGIYLPDGFIRHHISGKSLLVLDSFQRAPFMVNLDSFVRRRPAYLRFSDRAFAEAEPFYPLLSYHNTHQTADNRDLRFSSEGTEVQGQLQNRQYIAFGAGPELIAGLSGISGPRLPVTSYLLSDQAFGMTFGTHRWQMLVAGTGPAANRRGFGLKDSAPDITFAAGLTSRSDHTGARTSTFGFAVASGLDRPMGWDGDGAFRLHGQTMELGWGQGLYHDDKTVLEMTSRLSHLTLDSGPLTHFDDVLLLSSELAAARWISSDLRAAVKLAREAPVSSAYGYLHAATAITPNGHILYDDVRFSAADLMSFNTLHFGLSYQARKAGTVSLGVTGLRDGYGQTETLAGLRFRFSF